MEMVNKAPIQAKIVEDQVIFTENPKTKFLFILINETAYVLPQKIVYQTPDERFAVAYDVLQETGIIIGENYDEKTVNHAVKALLAPPQLEDKTLNEKIHEYGIHVKEIEGEYNYGFDFITTRDKKVSVRYNKGKTLFKAYGCPTDRDCMVVKDVPSESYYFLPRDRFVETKSDPDRGQFYLSQRVSKFIGANRWDLLTYLVDESEQERIDEMYAEVVGKGRGSIPQEKQKKEKKKPAARKKKVGRVATDALPKEKGKMERNDIQELLQNLFTHPRFVSEQMQLQKKIDERMGVTYTDEGVVLDMNGCKHVLKGDDIDKLISSLEFYRHLRF